MSDAHDHEPQSFISKYIFSYDHKMIGKQYLILAMLMAVVAGLLAMLIRLQLGWPGTQWPILGTLMPVGMASGVMTPEFYISLFTMHGTIMVFFVLSLAPVSGFGNLLILQTAQIRQYFVVPGVVGALQRGVQGVVVEIEFVEILQPRQ